MKQAILSIILLNCLLTLSAQNLHEKISINMTIKNFNRLDLFKDIEEQKSKSVLTSYGINILNSDIDEFFINLNDPLWKTMKISFMNNKVVNYTFQSKNDLIKEKLDEIFYDINSKYQKKFNVESFKSFSKQGYSITWVNNYEISKLNFILLGNNHFRATYTTKLNKYKNLKLHFNAKLISKVFLLFNNQDISEELINPSKAELTFRENSIDKFFEDQLLKR